FYVWARLGAIGLRGTYGDAFNTFHLSYTDTTGLSQTAPVPEPGTWLMLAAGLSALAWRRRSLSGARPRV
ncbi:MAG: PEP-CTERM sorting domain-containing protein, partial [Burkholderiaceae bacterium]|nr:PEP-CTERM sorting domain-containing protein [Burkholderiaceae bacterium]